MKIFLSCGFGDFLAITSWMTLEERRKIKEIYWASPSRLLCQVFVSDFYPNLEKEIILVDDSEFGNQMEGSLNQNDPKFRIASIDFKSDVKKRFHNNYNLDDVLDYNNPKWHKEIKSGIRKENQGLDFPQTKFNFKHKNYYVIHPHSARWLTERRDMNDENWDQIIWKMEKENTIGIILNKTHLGLIPDFIENSPYIENYSNKYSLKETVEIIRNSSGYIGTASCLAVMASHLVNPENFWAKTKEPQLKFYYPLIPRDRISWPNFKNL